MYFSYPVKKYKLNLNNPLVIAGEKAKFWIVAVAVVTGVFKPVWVSGFGELDLPQAENKRQPVIAIKENWEMFFFMGLIFFSLYYKHEVSLQKVALLYFYNF